MSPRRPPSGPAVATALLVLAAGAVVAAAPARAAGADPAPADVRAAVARSLPLLERAARVSAEARKQCFTCHNQALPVLALATARSRGFGVDGPNLAAQVRFTADFLGRNRANYLQGKGQGGQAHTAGYALWTLGRGGHAPDATTAAAAEYLLRHQDELGHWKPPSDRPPSEASPFATTYLALQGLARYGTPGQRDRIDRRVARARAWLLRTPAADTEDRVFRLWALRAAGAADAAVAAAGRELREGQRADGGWSQRPGTGSDAYATGTALVALHEAGGLGTADPAYRRGLAYLLAGQLGDGSWRVRTRSRPFRAYYESGYPHGEDQFISVTAAGWATTALALSLTDRPTE